MSKIKTENLPAGHKARKNILEEEVNKTKEYKKNLEEQRKEAEEKRAKRDLDVRTVVAAEHWKDVTKWINENRQNMKAYDNLASNLATIGTLAHALNEVFCSYNIPAIMWEKRGFVNNLKEKIKSTGRGAKLANKLGDAYDAFVETALISGIKNQMIGRGWIKPDEVDSMPDLTIKFGMDEKNKFSVEFEVDSRLHGKRKIEDDQTVKDLEKFIHEWLEKQGYIYNATTKTFTDKDGEELTNEHFQTLVNDDSKGFKTELQQRGGMQVFLNDLFQQIMQDFSAEENPQEAPKP